jgi:undecaprenyl-phosphate 4-deoxy-4-formamido-L-arabinose transferase
MHHYKPDLSVVVPVYNGSKTLEELFLRTQDALTNRGLTFEIVFVDDRSIDPSWSVIESMKARYGDLVQGIRLARNTGQQATTFCGMLSAQGTWIVTIDDDLQVPPEEIVKLLDAAQEQQAELVYGVFPSPKHNWLYHSGARIFRWVLHKIALDFPNGSSFRLLHADLIGRLPTDLKQLSHIDPFLLWVSTGFIRVEVGHEKRRHGRSGYSIARLVKMALEILILYSTLPLNFMIWAGFFFAAVSFGLGIYFMILKITIGAQMGFSALIVTITFFSGMILMSLGILGTYISNLYAMGIGRPPFVIQTKI